MIKNKARWTISQKVGCIFPVTRFTNLLRTHTRMRVSPTAGVFLAAIAQCTVEDILVLGSASAASRNYKRIYPRDVLIGMNADTCMSTVYKKHKILLPGAGIIPGHMTPQKCADSIVDSPGYRKKALEALKSAASTSALIDEDQSIDVSPSSVTPEKNVTPQDDQETKQDSDDEVLNNLRKSILPNGSPIRMRFKNKVINAGKPKRRRRIKKRPLSASARDTTKRRNVRRSKTDKQKYRLPNFDLDLSTVTESDMTPPKS